MESLSQNNNNNNEAFSPEIQENLKNILSWIDTDNLSESKIKSLVLEKAQEEINTFLKENKDFLWWNYNEIATGLKNTLESDFSKLNSIGEIIANFQELSRVLSWVEWIKSWWWNSLEVAQREANRKKAINSLIEFLEKRNIKSKSNEQDKKMAQIAKQQEEEKNEREEDFLLASQVLEDLPYPWEASEVWWETV